MTVAELRAIKADERGIELGASATLTEVARHAGVLKHYPVVAQAAGIVAGPTQRNMGTVGGNLCLDTRCIFYNQSEWWRSANNHCLKTTGDICHVAPKSRGVCFATFSGDLAPALLTLGAEVDLAGPKGRRTVPLNSIYIGFARQDVPVTETMGDGKYFLSLRPGEFVTADAREVYAGPSLGLRQDPHPPLHRVSGSRQLRSRCGATARSSPICGSPSPAPTRARFCWKAPPNCAAGRSTKKF